MNNLMIEKRFIFFLKMTFLSHIEKFHTHHVSITIPITTHWPLIMEHYINFLYIANKPSQ